MDTPRLYVSCHRCKKSFVERPFITRLPRQLVSFTDEVLEIWHKDEDSLIICHKCTTKAECQIADDFDDFTYDCNIVAELEQKLQVAKAEREKKAKALGLHLNTFGKFVRKVNK